jgi:hypothetical protein
MVEAAQDSARFAKKVGLINNSPTAKNGGEQRLMSSEASGPALVACIDRTAATGLEAAWLLVIHSAK